MQETVDERVNEHNNCIFGEYVESKQDDYSERCRKTVHHWLNQTHILSSHGERHTSDLFKITDLLPFQLHCIRCFTCFR